MLILCPQFYISLRNVYVCCRLIKSHTTKLHHEVETFKYIVSAKLTFLFEDSYGFSQTVHARAETASSNRPHRFLKVHARYSYSCW